MRANPDTDNDEEQMISAIEALLDTVKLWRDTRRVNMSASCNAIKNFLVGVSLYITANIMWPRCEFDTRS